MLRALLKCCNTLVHFPHSERCESFRGNNCPCAAQHSGRENAHNLAKLVKVRVPTGVPCPMRLPTSVRQVVLAHLRCHGHWCHAAQRWKQKKHHLSEDLPFQPLPQARCSAFGSSRQGLPFFSQFATSWRLVSHLPVACSLIIHGSADTVCAMFSVESV